VIYDCEIMEIGDIWLWNHGDWWYDCEIMEIGDIWLWNHGDWWYIIVKSQSRKLSRGMKFVGRSEDGERMEIMELEGKNH
jgi:hypothetical protein